jgi:hypothetical protein
MKKIKIIGNIYFYPLISGIICFIFFITFNKYHLTFREQFQLFQDTPEYFISFLKLPGGISGYLGEFLTQFFLFPIAGALIISLFILLIHLFTILILQSVNKSRSLIPLTFIPALVYATMFTDSFYPLAGIIGFTITLSLTVLYIKIKNQSIRLIYGILFAALLYFISGGSALVFIASAITFELFIAINDNSKNPRSLLILFAYSLILIVIIFAIPSILRHSYLHVPYIEALISDYYYDLKAKIPASLWVLFALIPLLIIVFSFSKVKEKNKLPATIFFSVITVLIILWQSKISYNPNAEEVMQYDDHARRFEWEKIINHAEKNPPRNNLSLSMLNLSLAKTNRLSTDLFKYRQNGIEGLFLNMRNENVETMMGNEILFHLGFMNAAQQYAFVSTETTASMQKSVRSIQRLVETNLINENFNVASKYLYLLENTFFYKKWAKSARNLIDEPELIIQHPVWSEMKRLSIKNDFFFNIKEIEKALIIMLDEHPANRMAFEYLMSYYLLNKDLNSFMNNLYRIDKINYAQMPVLYQEAALFAISLVNNQPDVVESFPVSSETKTRMRAYADIYTSSRNAKELLKEKYSSTFWYYFHFK